VMSGHAIFTVDGDELDAPAGTLVFGNRASILVRRSACTCPPLVGRRRGEFANHAAQREATRAMICAQPLFLSDPASVHAFGGSHGAPRSRML